MATVTTGPLFPFSDSYVNTRLVEVLESLRTAGVVTAEGYTQVTRNATTITYTTPEGFTLTFTAAGFSTSGLLTGTLNSAVENAPGVVFSITGLSFSLAGPVSYATVFAGNDTITGETTGLSGDVIHGGDGNDTLNGLG